VDPDEWKRVYDSEAFVAFTRESRSCVSGETPCVAAHITPNEDPPSGVGRKADAKWIAPMTYTEHLLLHSKGRSSCEQLWGIDLVEAAKRHWARFRQVHIRYQGFDDERGTT